MSDVMAIKPDSPLQVGEWQYLPEQDKLVQFGPDGKVIATADLDNLSQKVANYFIVHAGKLVTKDELLLDVWGIRDVSDGRVTRVIRVLRVALGDDTREPRYIETIPKRGYRFIAPVSAIVQPESHDTEEPHVNNIAAQVGKRGNKPWLLGTTAVALLVMLLSWWFSATDKVESDINATVPMLRYIPVTSLDGLEFYHNLSVDERYLVYSYASPDDENVTVLMLQDLQEHKRAQLTEPSFSSFGAAFSPDGSMVAYHRMYPDGGCEIRLMHLDLNNLYAASDEILVRCGDNSVSSRITWSPDGNYIAYPSMSEQKQMVIMLKSVNGGASEQLTVPPPSSFGDYAARFSRQGNQLVFLRNAAGAAQIWVLDMSNRATKMLVKVTDVVPGNVDWDLEDKAIIYPSAPTTLSKIDVATAKSSIIAYTDFNALELQMSSSGAIIATIGNFAHVNIKKVANLITGSSVVQETVFSSNRNETLAEANPLISGPTAVVSRRSGFPQVWLFYADGSQKQITHFDKNERFRSLVFSPDGRSLVAQINNEIWLLSENGLPKMLSGVSDNLIHSPGWSRDGKSIIYAESKNGRWHIMSHDLSGDLFLPKVFAEGKELYIESYDKNYSVWRDAVSKKFYVSWNEENRIEEIPIVLPEDQLWLKVQAKERGIYFTYLIDSIQYKLKFYSFGDKKVMDAVSVDYLYHSRFSVSSDERFVYILEAVRGDFDIAKIELQ